MLSHLNVNTRRIVLSLCKGEVAQLGQNIISSINCSSRALLAVISINKDMIHESKGQDLVDRTLKLLSKFQIQDVLDKSQSFDEGQKDVLLKKLKLASVMACSFRGLAPAGRNWEYDFEQKSHLIHGPNGSGKSSLLGAIVMLQSELDIS